MKILALSSWSQVSETTIIKCFLKAGFNNIAVMGGVMTDEEIDQDIIEVVEEEVQERDEEDIAKTLMKPTTEESRKAMDTLA